MMKIATCPLQSLMLLKQLIRQAFTKFCKILPSDRCTSKSRAYWEYCCTLLVKALTNDTLKNMLMTGNLDLKSW